MEARRERGAARGSRAGPVVTACAQPPGGNGGSALTPAGAPPGPGPAGQRWPRPRPQAASRPPFCSLDQSLAPPASVLLVRLGGGLGPSWHRGARCHVQGRSGCGWVTCWHRESRTRRSCRVGAGSAQPRCQEGPQKATRRPEGPGSDVCGPEERMVTSSCACGSLAGTGAVSLLPRLLGCWPGGFCETPLLG